MVFLFMGLLLFNCSDNNSLNACFSEVIFNETINLSNPQFINIQVPGGYTVAKIARRNILLLRRDASTFKAFDLQCPEKDCLSPMDFDGLKLVCLCNSNEYSSLNGCPIDENGECIRGDSCFALEYTVSQIRNSTIQIRR